MQVPADTGVLVIRVGGYMVVPLCYCGIVPYSLEIAGVIIIGCGAMALLNTGSCSALGSFTACTSAATCYWVASSACLNSLVEFEMVETLSLMVRMLALFVICMCTIESAMLLRLSLLYAATAQ